MSRTVSWYITFGLGTPDGKTYTEIRVPAYLPTEDQEAQARAAAFRRYGRQWAFHYPPEDFDDCIATYNLTLREVVTA